MIYCVIPRELADELYDKMVEYYKDNPNVEVIVDRREARPAGGQACRRVPGEAADSRPSQAQAPAASRIQIRRQKPGDQGSLESLPMAILGAKKFQNYIDGEWVDAASGATFESTSPANGETIGVFPKSGLEDVDHAVAAAKAALRGVAARPGAEARRSVLPLRAAARRARRTSVTELMTREMGKVRARGGRRRRPGSDRHGHLHGRRRPAPVRPDDALGAARQVPDVGADAGRCRRRDHAVELPDRDSRPGRLVPAIVCGNTVVLQAGGPTRPRWASASSELLAEAGLPKGVLNLVHGVRRATSASGSSSTRTSRSSPSPARARRVSRSRRRQPRTSSTSIWSSAARTRSSSSTTPTSSSPSTGSSGRPSAPPGQRCTAASRVIVHEAVYDQLADAPRRARRADAARPRLGATTPTVGPVINQAVARQDPLVHGDRHRTRALSSSPAARSPTGNGLDKGFLLPSDDLRRRSIRRCGSRRRRSSARRRR